MSFNLTAAETSLILTSSKVLMQVKSESKNNRKFNIIIVWEHSNETIGPTSKSIKFLIEAIPDEMTEQWKKENIKNSWHQLYSILLCNMNKSVIRDLHII